MKGELKLIKSKKGSLKKQSAVEKLPCKLFAVCLNRPLIELWALAEKNSGDHTDADLQYSASVYTKSHALLHHDDRIPVLLSTDDMMMLYNEGLSDYY
jgi:hypothetical protein